MGAEDGAVWCGAFDFEEALILVGFETQGFEVLFEVVHEEMFIANDRGDGEVFGGFGDNEFGELRHAEVCLVGWLLLCMRA